MEFPHKTKPGPLYIQKLYKRVILHYKKLTYKSIYLHIFDKSPLSIPSFASNSSAAFIISPSNLSKASLAILGSNPAASN